MAAFLITKASVFISANMLQKLPASLDLVDIPFLPFPWLPWHQTHLVCLFLLLFCSVHADCLQSSYFPQNGYSSGISPGSVFRQPSPFFPPREGSALCPHRLEPASATQRLQRAQPGPPFTAAVTYRGQWAPSSIRGASEMETASQRLWKLHWHWDQKSLKNRA